MKNKTVLLLAAAILTLAIFTACSKKEDSHWKYFGDPSTEARA